MFPTDFQNLKDLYRKVCLQSGETKLIKIYAHRKFLEQWGDTKATKTISGENPMLDWFENVKFLITQ